MQSPLFLQLFKDKLTGIISGVSINNLKQLFLPLPPLEEQERIVEKFKFCEPLLSRYELIEQNITLLETSLEEKLKASILQYAIEGKLVKQNPNDEPASVLLERIKAEKEKLISEGKIKRDKNDSIIEQSDDKNYYCDLPKTWLIIKIGQVLDVYRGGSPRPIESFLTTKQDGINWVKIGDTIQGDKYIVSCKQKIIKDGLSKTRLIQPGDLLLTNSMSFGRPYISKIYGAVHDGWLVFSDFSNSFDKDYLFYLLSSVSILEQFKSTVSGAVVKNLNIDKVKNTNKNYYEKNIPTGWALAKIGQLGTLTRGSGIKRTDIVENGCPCIRYGELYTTYKIAFSSAISHTTLEIYRNAYKANENDILMTLTGENKKDISMALAYLGKDQIAYGGDMTCLSNHNMNPLYLVYAINSPYGRYCMQQLSTGDIIVHMSNDRLNKIYIPIPPLNEQKKIVIKVNQIFSLID